MAWTEFQSFVIVLVKETPGETIESPKLHPQQGLRSLSA